MLPGRHGSLPRRAQSPFLRRLVAAPEIRRDIKHSKEWGVPPTVWWGRAAGDGSWTIEDRAIIAALDDWEDSLCPGCGKPYASHKAPSHYTAAAIDCPELAALDRDQVAQAKRDGNKDVKTDPERSRRWISGTSREITDIAEHLRQLETGEPDG